MRSLLTGAVVLGDIYVKKLRFVTAKSLYLGVHINIPVLKFYVWSKLQNPSNMGREIVFLIVHNIVSKKDRVFKFNICGVLQYNVHQFCECLNAREAWF